MSVKERMIAIVQEMPDDLTTQEALDYLVFRLRGLGLLAADTENGRSHEVELLQPDDHFVRFSIERGLRQMERGEVLSHEEAKKRLGKWRV